MSTNVLRTKRELQRDEVHRTINRRQHQYEISCRDGDWVQADELERALEALRALYDAL